MKQIIIFGNSYQGAYAAELSLFFRKILGSGELHVAIDAPYRDYLASLIPDAIAGADVLPESAEGASTAADLAISIGGDGTFLHTANRIAGSQIPIMGINSGHLGYLSAAPMGSVDRMVADIENACYIIEPRSMIMASCAAHRLHDRPFALNEAALLRQDTGSMITVDARVNSEPLASYQGDGLIVCTPTGSTAYNLSAGGPILAPRCANFVITPIAPHSLNMRPLVIGDDTTIELVPKARANTFTLALDGRARAIPVGARIILHKAPFVTNVVRLPHHTFADTLRGKLLWGVSSR